MGKTKKPKSIPTDPAQLRKLKVKPAKAKQPKSMKPHSTRILLQQKRRQALEARKAGATYQQIADNLGYTHASAARKAVLKAFGDVIQEPVNELRSLQVERLNHMLLRIWQRVDAGDLDSMAMALRIIDKIDALIGTEAAQQLEVKQQTTGVLVVDGNKDDYIVALKRMAGLGIGPDGKNLAAQDKWVATDTQTNAPSGKNYPPGMGPKLIESKQVSEPEGDGDVLVATLVEDEADANESGSDVVLEEAVDVPTAFLTKKKFCWGVDPTVTR